LIVGQHWTGVDYHVYRSYVYFDTSALPSTAIIDKAVLQLWGAADGSATDFDICVVNGQPASPHDPLTIWDFDRTLYSGLGGTLNTAVFAVGAYNSVSINSTALGWINTSGTTKLCLWSSRDDAATVPIGQETVTFRDAGMANPPQLVIEWHIDVVSGPLTSGEYTVKTTANTTDMKLYIDAVEVDTASLDGASVSANITSGWLLYPIYWSYYKHTVSSTLVAHYQPNDVIHGAAYSAGTATFANGSANVTNGGVADWDSTLDGAVIKLNADNVWHVIDSVTSNTTLTLASAYTGVGGSGAYTIAPRLPDRAGTLQDGAITWGANPAGVTLTLGSFATTEALGGSAVDVTPDTLPDMETSDWFTESNNSTLSTNPFYPVVRVLSSTGGLSTFTEQQVWRFFAIMAILLLMAGAAKVVPGHILAIGVAQMVGMSGAAALTIFPIWTIVVAAGFLMATLVMERSISW
jgi:hypothetical protein